MSSSGPSSLPGDFVRNVKQLVDLLRQLAVVAPDPPTAAAAHRAADGAAARRGGHVVGAGAASETRGAGPVAVRTSPGGVAEARFRAA